MRYRRSVAKPVEELEPLPLSAYEMVDLDHLVMYAVGQLERVGAELSFENAVVAAFKLFPKKFALVGFPSYPDGKRVHDALFRCTFRTKQWLGGKTRQGFTITDRSRIFIREAEELLTTPSQKLKAHSQTRRKESLLSEVMSSTAYKKYAEGRGDSISEAEFSFLLQGTLDSARATLKENFLALERLATELDRSDAVDFLLWLRKHFGGFLESK